MQVGFELKRQYKIDLQNAGEQWLPFWNREWSDNLLVLWRYVQ